MTSRQRATSTLLLCLSLVALLAPGGHAQELDSALLAPFEWRAIGPTATGGRITDMAVLADDVSTILVASASGGLWKTDNNGTTWRCIFQNEGTISIGAIACDPVDPQVMWVGTGEANNQRSSLWGDGVYKTTDGGETWVNTGLKDTHHIGRIVLDPNDRATVYVAAMGHLYSLNEERGLYKTRDGGETWERVLFVDERTGIIDVVLDPDNPATVYAAVYERQRRAWNFDGNGPGSGIHKSTDAGKTWRRLDGGLPEGDIGRIGLAISPRNPNVLYATVSNQNLALPAEPEPEQPQGAAQTDEQAEEEPEEPEGIATPFGFRVQFEDDVCRVVALEQERRGGRPAVRKGDTLSAIADERVASEWDLLAALLRLRAGDRVHLRLRRDDKDRDITVTVPDRPRRPIGGEIYRSEDGGETWEKRNDKPVGGSPAYYYGQIRIDPADENRLYLLSVPVYGSEDGGKTWESSLARSVHVDHHAMWINPANPEHIVLGNDGGLHISYDRAATWDHVFNLPLTQFYAIGVDMQKPYHVFGGTQDNGSWGGPSRSRNPAGVGRFDWYRVGGGDGFYVEPDPSDSNIVFGESQFGALYRLDKSTGERRSIRPPASDPGGLRDRYNWNSPILISHHNPRTIYFGGNRLFKSYNRGDDWTVISPDLSTRNLERMAGNVPYCTITTIAESIFDRDVLLAGTDDGNVQWTEDGGASWTHMASRFPLRPRDWWCSRVELSRHDPDTAYVTFTGYREDDFRPFVFVTTDRGENWRSISGDLPLGCVNVVEEDRRNPDVLWLGTDLGAFFSDDRGVHWAPLDRGLPTIAVHDLVVHPRERDLVIGTHGRGMFILDDITPLQELSAEVRASKTHLFSVRNAVAWRRVSTQGISGDRRELAPNPPNGATIHYFLKDEVPEGENLSLTVVDGEGKRVRALEAPRAAGLHRVVWSFGGGGRFGRRGGGAPSPGTYTVVLKLGDDEQRQTLVVEPDPLGT